MSCALRRALLGIAPLVSPLVLLAPAGLASGCAGQVQHEAVTEAAGTSGTTNAPIKVDVGSLFMTIENQAGQPLVSVRLAVQPVGPAMPFTLAIARMESGERRDLRFDTFVARDNTRFNPRTTRAREIVVTATDLVGREHQYTVPWPR